MISRPREREDSPEKELPLVNFFLRDFLAKRPWARRFRDDLQSIGYLTLVKYWDDYNPELGAFSTFMRFKLFAAFDRGANKEMHATNLPDNYSYSGKKISFLRIDRIGEDKFSAERGVPEEICSEREKEVRLLKAVLSLDEDKRFLLIRNFGLFSMEPMGIRAIAKQEKVSFQAIQQRREKALESLRKVLR